MKWFQHRVGLLTLIALLCSVGMLAAQEDSPITVVGSGRVAPAFEALAAASSAPLAFQTEVTGTNVGFERLCSGAADVALANRTINTSENDACTANSVTYIEQLIAHDIIAFIAAPDAVYNQCLTQAEVNSIFPPSAQTTDWAQIGTGNASTPLSVIVPDSASQTYAVLDSIVQGDGLRADVETVADDAAVIETVGGNTGAIGAVSLNAALNAGDAIRILQLNANEAVGCTSPSVENVEARSYTAADSFYAYINQSSLDKAGVKDLFTFIASEAAAPTAAEQNLQAPSAAIQATNLASLEGSGEAAPFSADSTAFQIPFDVSGTVAAAGTASGREYLNNLATQFQSIYSTVTIEVNTAGQPAGIRRLCNGEIDMVVMERALTDEETQNCDANNITTLPIDLGKQVVVLAGNGNSPYLACLTTDQLATIFSGTSTDTVTTWNQVDASFPEQAMTLFQPEVGHMASDLLLASATGVDTPRRDDTEIDDDVLYRAAATANVDGALTYMTWADYQGVLANNQDRIQLVGVDGGNGCVTPTVDTIADGSYPLTRSLQLLVNTASLSKPQVQSVLWYLASDENYPLLEQSGLTGVGFGSLATLRKTLERAYLDAQQAAIEATPEPGAEGTAEATGEALEVTPEPAAEATTEATVEATSEATAETTPAS